jgi:hypothetical protein
VRDRERLGCLPVEGRRAVPPAALQAADLEAAAPEVGGHLAAALRLDGEPARARVCVWGVMGSPTGEEVVTGGPTIMTPQFTPVPPPHTHPTPPHPTPPHPFDTILQ